MKNLILSKYNELSILFMLSIIAGVLLMFRIKITESFYLLFLVWNIFLAAIPYGITLLVQLKRQWFSSKVMQLITFLIWLLFLPNAPYILSDFTHLQWSKPSILPVDTTIIGLFSILGLLYMAFSIKDMKRLIFVTLSRKQNLLFTISICALIGLGIYLGRYLRWNSWDIMHNPVRLIEDIGALVVHPIRHRFAWLVTITYASLSWISIALINKLKWTH